MKKIAVSREDILKTGVEMMTSGNAKTLTLRDLSSKTGVSVGTLYNYFGDKEQLQREVLGYFWRRTMLQEGLLHEDNMDFISHVEKAYGLFFNNFQKINRVMSNTTSNTANKLDIQAAFPMDHIVDKLESWIEGLMDLHDDELKVAASKCTIPEIMHYIVAAYTGNFIAGIDNLGISMKVLREYLMK